MGIEEHTLREWVQRVATGQASRRHFLRTMLGLGLSGPFIADMLTASAPHGFLIKILPASATPQTYWGSQRSLRALPENSSH
jgi:hypothetical protein